MKYISLYILISFCGASFAQNTIDTNQYQINAPLITETITIDGIDNENVWQQNTSIAKNFFQTFPYDTSYSTTKTEVKVLYDANNIYVFAKCFDTFSEATVVQSLKRDYKFN